MSIRDIHFNPTIFPSPHSFNPSRWLTATPTELAHMNKHLVTFGKGVRACSGTELAKLEMVLLVANLYWRFDMRLFETGEEDVRAVHDYFTVASKRESKGVRVVIVSEGVGVNHHE
ncbi:cytochrome P450 [Byssothecium circinans]|uniref:Cytochrome P450 n=1 Tax=Byssothecium circinans TaxID=147558 RepID=A0A6A5U9N1_9PLEO|nr:cytochrome P450 [Byssothecium circinans]